MAKIISAKRDGESPGKVNNKHSFSLFNHHYLTTYNYSIIYILDLNVFDQLHEKVRKSASSSTQWTSSSTETKRQVNIDFLVTTQDVVSPNINTAKHSDSKILFYKHFL